MLASPMEATALPGFRMGAASFQDTAAQLAARCSTFSPVTTSLWTPVRHPAARRRMSWRSLRGPSRGGDGAKLALVGHLPVERQNFESLAPLDTERTEVPLIECKHFRDTVPLG